MKNFLALIVNTVAADMCEDFCISQTTTFGCPKGSWCKNNYDCHGLFWTSAERRTACVLDGPGPCTDRFPVLCREAAQKSVRSEPIDPRSLTFIDITCQSPRMYYCSPYIKIRFPNDERNLGYWALFDSGSDISYALLEPYDISSLFRQPIFIQKPQEPILRPANETEGYILRPGATVIGDPGVLAFGWFAVRYFNYSGIVLDKLNVFSGNQSFEFNESLVLAPSPGDGQRILLGAAYDSTFAESAGSFALIPSIDLLNGYRVVIGNDAAQFVEQFCDLQKPLNWYPIISNRAWIITGSISTMTVSPYSTQPMRRPIELFIDTGASTAIYLPIDILNQLRDIIRSSGAINADPPGRKNPFSYYTNCDPNVRQILPSVKITFNANQRPLYVNEFHFHPSSYFAMLQTAVDDGYECVLQIAPNREDRPLVISNNILSEGVSVFDHINRRFGFCPKNTPRINQYLNSS